MGDDQVLRRCDNINPMEMKEFMLRRMKLTARLQALNQFPRIMHHVDQLLEMNTSSAMDQETFEIIETSVYECYGPSMKICNADLSSAKLIFKWNTNKMKKHLKRIVNELLNPLKEAELRQQRQLVHPEVSRRERKLLTRHQVLEKYAR